MKRYLLSLACAVAIAAGCSKDEGPGPTNDGGNDLGETLDLGAPDDGSQEEDLGSIPEDLGADVATADMGHDVGADMGSAGPLDSTATSGTRLRRMYLGTDGLESTVALWDSELEVPCSFRELQGELRCVPTYPHVASIQYLDASCTQPLFADGGTCDSRYAVDFDEQQYYRSTPTPAVLSGEVHVDLGGCYNIPSDPDVAYRVPEAIAPAEFVPGTRDDIALEGGMIARYITGDDGSRVLTETVHATLGFGCTFKDEHCVPTLAGTRLFTDAGCADPVFSFDESQTPPVITYRPRRSNGCLADDLYFARGGEYGSGPLFSRDDAGACTPATRYTVLKYFRPGRPMLLSDFPAVERRFVGSGDLLGFQ